MGVERAKPSARTLNRYAFFFTASKVFRTYCRRQATDAMGKLIRDGLIRGLGLSQVSGETLKKR